MNQTIINLMKKELKRLEKAYGRAKEHAQNVANAPQEYTNLIEGMIETVNDKSIAPKDLLKKLEDMKVKQKNLEKLMDQDYCELVEKEVKLLMQLQKMQRDVNAIEFEERAIGAWNKKRSMMRADGA